MAGFYKKLRNRWRERKGGGRRAESERLDATLSASSTRGSNDIQHEQERLKDSVDSLSSNQESPATQSLWDRAYDALAEEEKELVKEYEKLLAKEEQVASRFHQLRP